MQQSNPALQQNSNDNSEEHHIEQVKVCVDKNVNGWGAHPSPLFKRGCEDGTSSKQLPKQLNLSCSNCGNECMPRFRPCWIGRDWVLLLSHSTSCRLIKHRKVKVPEVTTLWVTFIIAILKTKKRVLFGTFRSIFQLFWTKIMETKVILRIISKAFIYQFSKVSGMAVGTPTVAPQSVISQREQPRI